MGMGRQQKRMQMLSGCWAGLASQVSSATELNAQHSWPLTISFTAYAWVCWSSLRLYLSGMLLTALH